MDTMSTETETEEIYEPNGGPASDARRGAAIARNATTTYFVGLDDSNNDPDLDAWVIWTESVENGILHYDVLEDKCEVVTDPELDLHDAADIAHLQLKRVGLL